MDFASLITELKDTATKISTYFKEVSSYLTTGTGAPPVFEETVSTLSTDNATTIASATRYGGDGYSSGVITSYIYEVAAMKRESSMGLMRKSDFYVAEAVSLNTDADDYFSEIYKKLNYAQSNSPEQDITI